MSEAGARRRIPPKYCVITTVDVTMSSFIIPVLHELKKRGYDVTMICNMSKSFYDRYQGTFRCVNINMSRGTDVLSSLRAVIRLYRIFRREKFDIVQYSTPNAAFYSSLAAFLAGQKIRLYGQWGMRYVGFENVLVWQIFKIIEKATCALSTHIRAVSRKNMEYGIQSGLYKRGKVKVLGNGGTIGVDLNRFPVGLKGRWRSEMIARYPALKDKVVFGFVGRIMKDKGINELLQAFREIQKRREDAALLLLGGYSPEKSGVDPVLWEWARNHQSVVWCGHVHDVPRYMSLMDIFVHPSYREGFSMVIQEAQALGLPVITTNIPGPSEVIAPGVTGRLAKPRDARSLQAGMVELLEDSRMRLAFGTAGPQRVKDCFNREWMIANILNDLASLVKPEEVGP